MKKAVYLLHGFLSDTNDFSPIMEFLNGQYDHVEMVSYPGHNQEEDYELFNDKDTINLVVETFDKLKKQYDVIDVIGYSMGGAIAVYLSNIRIFNKLILLAPANKYINFRLPFSRLAVLISRFLGIKNANKILDQEKVEYYKLITNAIGEDDKESFKFLIEKYFKKYIYGAYRNFRRIISTCNKEITEIKNPTFIAWGSLDQLVPKSSVEYLYNNCINVKRKLKIYPHLCHLMLNSQFNDELIQDVKDFIKE